jgi:hypothetical protein
MASPVKARTPITHGLIIDTPWIDLILEGRKTWENRSTRTSRRGTIALIRKGSGAIYGTVVLSAVVGPLGPEQLKANRRRMGLRTPMSDMEASELADRWPYAWEMKDAEILPHPVAYNHPAGAVIWVVLDARARGDLRRAQNQREQSQSQGASDVDARPPLEQRYIDGMQPLVRPLYEQVRQVIFGMGDDVESGGVSSDSYVYFARDGVRFATIRRKGNGFWLAVTPAVLNLEPNKVAQLHHLTFQRPDSRHWARTDVTHKTQINHVAAVVRAAYCGANESNPYHR